MREKPAYDRWYGLGRWKKRAKRQLQAHPLCAMHLQKGMVVAATIADHIDPHRGDVHAFWNGALQSLCVGCHNSTKLEIEKRGYSTEIGVDGWPTDRQHPSYRR